MRLELSQAAHKIVIVDVMVKCSELHAPLASAVQYYVVYSKECRDHIGRDACQTASDVALQEESKKKKRISSVLSGLQLLLICDQSCAMESVKLHVNDAVLWIVP